MCTYEHMCGGYTYTYERMNTLTIAHLDTYAPVYALTIAHLDTYARMYALTTAHLAFRGQRVGSTMWVPGTKLRSSGLVASIFTSGL